MAMGYRPVDRDQMFLLPPDMRGWLPVKHFVWFLLAVIEELDVSPFEASRRWKRWAGKAPTRGCCWPC